MADNATFVRSLYEAWNNREWDYAANAMAPDGEIVDVPSGTTARGPEGMRTYNATWADAFPDGRITINRVIESGDVVVAEYTGRGTHTGPLVTDMGTIQPTGKSVTLEFCDVNEVGGGMLKRQRSYWDTGSLMTQLGLATSPTATTQKG